MIATYRLQLTPQFTFADAKGILPYLQLLGVSHVYLSPITEAVFGSAHGYDVEDHNAIRKELGGDEGWEDFLKSLHEASLKLILDFVPNHAGVGPENEAWQSVLAYGQNSPFANYFDIDWQPLEQSLTGKVLLPFLGQSYGECLDAGDIRLIWYEENLRAEYAGRNFSLCPESYADILAVAMTHSQRTELYFDLKELREAYQALRSDDIPRAEMLQQRLQSLPRNMDWEAVLGAFQGDRLHSILEMQHWRLAYWKAGSYETNYRRFFDVNGLVALRIQDSQVFWSTHRLLSSLATQQDLDGVRIDHIDGLHDPLAYLKRLHELGIRHVWVEKVLAPGEILPADWPVEGTTGYDFMNDVMHVLIDHEGMEAIVRTYHRFVPESGTFHETIRESKRLIMETSLASDLNRLAYELNNICKADYHTRDFALGALREALAELIAAIDRYRTYLPYDETAATAVIQQATQRACRQTPSFEPSIYNFISDVIFGKIAEKLLPLQQAWLGRFQQYCSAVAAKGVEDTSFYRYVPQLALNEVGGVPQLGPQKLQAFHSHAKFRARTYPRNLLATATHDHKRGEDTRMRLLALSLVPDLWEETLRKLDSMNEPHQLQGPSRRDKYLFFQTLVAVWNEGDRTQLAQRLQEYLLKAIRESKLQTSWNHPNQEYEATVQRFIEGILAAPELGQLLEPLNSAVSRFGFLGSLSQILLKLLSPGVPDIYQGCELQDLSLVDPDNRRSVDYAKRLQMLEQLQELLREPQVDVLRRLIESQDEAIKLFAIARMLKLRQQFPEIFEDGSYHELKVEGAGAEHWIAFVRRSEKACLLAIVPCFRALCVNALSDELTTATIVLEDPERGHSWRDFLTDLEVGGGDTIGVRSLPLHWGVLVRSAAS
jgi:(1->4)-alpha-D-glucan 1-alpha-D-glucosylmutase